MTSKMMHQTRDKKGGTKDMKFEDVIYRVVMGVLLVVIFLSAICFFGPILMGGYEGVIENDGIILASMYGISVLGFAILYLKKK